MLTQEELKKILDYNKDTGVFTWKISNSNIRQIGSIAGTINKGYFQIKINKKPYMAHRLAWLYVYGEMLNKKQQIDHINHNRSDNRISNLRVVTNAENQKNISMKSNNKSGVIGVSWAKRESRWSANITIDGKQKHLGYFVEFSDAVNARKNAEVLYGFHENHGKEI